MILGNAFWLVVLILVPGPNDVRQATVFDSIPPPLKDTAPKRDAVPWPVRAPKRTGCPKEAFTDICNLQQAVLDGDFEQIAAILNANDDIEALANGFRFPEDRASEFLRRTEERARDPDVATFKGFAKASLDRDVRHRNAKKLAKVAVRSIRPSEVYCCIDEWKLIEELTKTFEDQGFLDRVLSVNPATNLVDEQRNRRRMRRRLLLEGGSPAFSTFCARCWPIEGSKGCGTAWWCSNFD